MAYRGGREAEATGRAIILERLERLRGERRTITETRPIGAITALINDAHRSEQPALRAAREIAKRRDAIDAELVTFEQRLASLSRVVTGDASAAVLSAITSAAISESMVRRFRLACLLAPPLYGGLVVAIGLALVPATRPSQT
jgi:hypothetical protein